METIIFILTINLGSDHLTFEGVGGGGRLQDFVKKFLQSLYSHKNVMIHKWPREKNACTDCEAKKILLITRNKRG